MKHFARATLPILALMLSVQAAFAHVGWRGRDLITDAISSTANPDGSTTYLYDRGDVTSNWGWADGLSGALAPNPTFDDWGDSHRVRFTKFYLPVASYVSITVSAQDWSRNTTNDNTTTRLGDLNPAFSIYSGSGIPNPCDPATAPWACHDLVPQASFDWPADSAGPSAPRAHLMGKEGLFVANGDITMATNAAVINTQYFTGHWASNPNGNSVSLTDLLLNPGWYSVIVGGAREDAIAYVTSGGTESRNPNDYGSSYPYLGTHADLDNGSRGFNVELTVRPVPVPAAGWLFGAAVLGLVGLRRRNQIA